MPSPAWSWDSGVKRFRDNTTGRFLSEGGARKLRDAFLDTQKEKTADLAARLAKGDLTLAAWEKEMREHTKTVFVAEAMLGRGGRNAMGDAAWGQVGRQLRDQYEFLRGFAEDVATGAYSEAQIAARAALYVESASQAYERGRAGAYGVTLPAYPGDGRSCEGKANCRCSWSIQEDEHEVRASWLLGGAQPCETCKGNAATWAPLTIPKGERARLNGHHRTACC